MFVYACIFWNDTLRHWNRCHVPEKQFPWAAVGGPHSGHPRASGLPFFSAICKGCEDPIWRTPPRGTAAGHASWAPEAPLSFRKEVSNARSAHYNPVPWPATADLAGLSPSRCPRASAAPLRKQPRFADVCICTYMYVCIYVYEWICSYI